MIYLIKSVNEFRNEEKLIIVILAEARTQELPGLDPGARALTRKIFGAIF